MTAIIGEGNQQYTLPLLQLVIADSAYCDANKDQEIGMYIPSFKLWWLHNPHAVNSV